MTSHLFLRSAALAILTALLAACAGPEVMPRDVPPAPVASVAEADQQLAAVGRERAAIEAGFAERERVCYTRFFTNSCLDDARNRRRSALAAQRAIEVQAAHFKRQAAVEVRDRNLAEAEKRYQAEEARLAAQPLKPAPAVTPAPPPPPRTPTAPVRSAQRNARVQQAQQKEAADAGKRAANVSAYEKRKADSEERQRKVAQRKAEKAAKEAAEKAKE
jgi:colicin import membrane protein